MIASSRTREARPRADRTWTVTAADGAPLAVDLYLPAGPAVARALVAPAMGVKKRFYAPFAADMAAHGVATLVADYRGIGESLRGPVSRSRARLSEWGELDLPAVTRALAALDIPLLGDAPLSFVGHSVGGQLFGLMPENPFRSALFVGSQSGYWRHYPGWRRAGIATLWHVGVPALATTLGYLPMRALGQGEDLPAGVAREWARWGRDPRYVGVRVAELERSGYATWSGQLRALSISDDGYAPLEAVEALVRHYSAAWVDVSIVEPRALGVKRVGHFGWFRPRFRETAWADARTWLLGAAGVVPEGVAA